MVVALLGIACSNEGRRRIHRLLLPAQLISARAAPLALAPSPCTHRDVCIEALVGAGLEWRVTFTSASQQGLRSAAKAGLAITIALQDDIQDGLVVAGEGLGLPALPAVSLACAGPVDLPARPGFPFVSRRKGGVGSSNCK